MIIAGKAIVYIFEKKHINVNDQECLKKSHISPAQACADLRIGNNLGCEIE